MNLLHCTQSLPHLQASGALERSSELHADGVWPLVQGFGGFPNESMPHLTLVNKNHVF